MVSRESVEEARWSLCGELTANDQRNMVRYNAWLGAWMLLWVAVRFAGEGWAPAREGVLAWALIAATILPGVATLRAYVRFVREADELLRKIQLEALALAFGVGAVFMMAWRLVERAGGPALDVNDPLLVMFAVWLGAQWWGARRYR
jgi:hypothetical protein